MVGGYTNADRRAALWVKAQELKTFTSKQLAADTSGDACRVRVTLKEWIAEGKVENTGTTAHRRIIYRVLEADEVVTHGLDPLENMWRAARLMGEFSPVSLAMHAATEQAPITEDDARAYCRVLLRGGYLRVIRTAVPGRRSAVYRTIKNPGPLYPREHRVRAVWDPNLAAFAHVSEPSQ